MTPVRAMLAASCATATMAAGALTALPVAVAAPVPGVATPGLASLLADGTPSGRAIVTLDQAPDADTVAALERLGLRTQPMQRLPLVIVAGPVEAMQLAVTSGIAEDVYPDEQLELYDTASSDVVSSSPASASRLRDRGLTGKDVTVGIVDSGCDATHPDLAERVTHNVALVSGEYANVQPDSSNTIVVATDEGPYSNTDLGSGHGTHVAGIVAADSSSVDDGSRLGVAPDAELACFAIGAVLFTTAVVTAYDYMLDQPDLLGIDVVNNSWGNSYRQFDPRDPVSVATKAVADQGVTVVFAAGNSGRGNTSATLNPFSQAPWVVSVAAATLDRARGDFSSNGLRFDNSQAVPIGAGGHTTFSGDRLGLVHPDVAAPGVDISSTCDSAGTLIGPCAPGDNAEASGTSMASPHVAGAAAVLHQARPGITPTQVRQALEATASVVTAADGVRAPFWQVGFGHVNLDRAVSLVQRSDWRSALASAAAAAESRALASDGTQVLRSDLHTWDAPRASVGTDRRTFRVQVGRTAQRLEIALVHPSGGTVGANVLGYSAVVTDPRGFVVGRTGNQGAGTAVASIDLTSFRDPAGTYTVEVTGDESVSDPDTVDSDSVLGRMVTLAAAQTRRG